MDPFDGFPARLRILARESRKNGELPKAILLWNAIKGFEPDDREAREAVSALEATARREAESHFRNGVDLQDRGNLEAARWEFLLALAADPGHEDALRRVKGTAGPPEIVVYEIRRGDTPRSVATKVYDDPEMAILVSHFAEGGQGGNGTLEEGKRVVLPAPEPWPEANGPKPGNSLSKVRTLFREGRYREAARQAEKILAGDPGNRYAGEVRDAAYYRIGMAYSREGNFREALRYLGRVDPGYEGAGNEVATLEARLEEADSLYAKGLRHFLAEELDAAETDWMKALELDPRHPKAGRDLKKVRRMKGALQRMQ